MPFYFGLKQNGVLLINHDGPMKLPPQETNELKERNAKLYYIPATQLSLKVAGLHFAPEKGRVGAVGGRAPPATPRAPWAAGGAGGLGGRSGVSRGRTRRGHAG